MERLSSYQPLKSATVIVNNNNNTRKNKNNFGWL